ncbi:MAG: hypothetical protein AVDCRST_MAG52-1758 [uncultured Blastococcus sp.]|uniref:Uncharacterized protein n=1 Tax=uncultured Blastococcus sp. TaxID=217144 RepID=A0A6J4I7K2_9ACTN|nr:MAG: hypothetical protein AVDCRST_MAG52-1758 [uncultured Blastococcus sp.]
MVPHAQRAEPRRRRQHRRTGLTPPCTRPAASIDVPELGRRR